MTSPGPAPAASGALTQASRDGAPLAAFDFDGTLTVKDSFSAFLRWRAGPFGWAWGLVRLAPAALAYVVTRDRGRLKSACVHVFLEGAALNQLKSDARAFQIAHAGRLLRPDALAAWETHRTRGDRLVIVTASPEEIVRPFAEHLGADVLIGTRLSETPDGRIGRGLIGLNCRGAEKVHRLQAVFGDHLDIIDAYGDTRGDREMLALARRGHMRVFKGRPRH